MQDISYAMQDILRNKRHSTQYKTFYAIKDISTLTRQTSLALICIIRGNFTRRINEHPFEKLLNASDLFEIRKYLF